jgi:hypothetical protein
MSKSGAERLYGMLARNHDLAGKIDGREFPLDCFETLQQFQRNRIARSFDDLNRQEGYRPAVEFFLSEIYGGLHFRDRDQDMGRVMPVMTRFLPDRTLMTMSEAFELQSISLEFDMEMAEWMARWDVEVLDMATYCRVYLAVDDREGRERQIHLIRKLGYDLDQLVRKSFINYLVRLLRGPAHAAGFGNLQEFLESGLNSFRALEDPEYFIETIYVREWEAMERMFDGEENAFRL